MRDTKHRAAISDTFKKAGNRLLSPKEVTAMTSEQIPGLGIATVYRNIKTMVALGELQAVMLPGQPDRYTLAGTDVGVIMMTKDGQVTHTTGITSSCEVSLFSKHTYFIEK